MKRVHTIHFDKRGGRGALAFARLESRTNPISISGWDNWRYNVAPHFPIETYLPKIIDHESVHIALDDIEERKASIKLDGLFFNLKCYDITQNGNYFKNTGLPSKLPILKRRRV
jgi:hypothetical protein